TKVGGSMSRIQAWKEVVDKVKARLLRWKMKTLSIGGCLTLLKSVLGSLPIFHMSIFKVSSKVLHELGSLRGHFFNGHEAVNNHRYGLRLFRRSMVMMVTFDWVMVNGLNSGLILGLVEEFLKIYILVFLPWRTRNKSLLKVLHEVIKTVKLVPMEDRWVWNLENSGLFTVSSLRKKIDAKRLARVAEATRWIKFVPIKVNVLAWKVMIDALPTRLNISLRGISIRLFLALFVIVELNLRIICFLGALWLSSLIISF
nr:RNA-directed DNA polymerase, eukaryota [Tanacetum cinerariifolium]